MQSFLVQATFVYEYVQTLSYADPHAFLFGEVPLSLLEAILIILLSLLFGVFILGMFLHKKKLAHAFEQAQRDSQKILEDAQKEADRIIKSSIHEGKEESRKRRKSFEDEAKKRKAEINKVDQRLKQREINLQNKLASTESREKKAEAFEQKLLEQEKKQMGIDV